MLTILFLFRMALERFWMAGKNTQLPLPKGSCLPPEHFGLLPIIKTIS
jgi:hypothetical protein